MVCHMDLLNELASLLSNCDAAREVKIIAMRYLRQIADHTIT